MTKLIDKKSASLKGVILLGNDLIIDINNSKETDIL
jgi:hypothetical protein